jgi:hypothetical protein
MFISISCLHPRAELPFQAFSAWKNWFVHSTAQRVQSSRNLSSGKIKRFDQRSDVPVQHQRKNIQHTVRCTELSPERFKSFLVD